MKMALFAMISVFAAVAIANDGGIAGIKVNEIRMREYSWKNGEEKEIRRITDPNFKITFSGLEARKLQQALPSEFSVITSMQPELKPEFDRTFKALGIYSDKTAQVTEKVVTIRCTDGELESIGETGKMRIKKKAQTECEISIVRGDAADMLGDVAPFEPGQCRQ